MDGANEIRETELGYHWQRIAATKDGLRHVLSFITLTKEGGPPVDALVSAPWDYWHARCGRIVGPEATWAAWPATCLECLAGGR